MRPSLATFVSLLGFTLAGIALAQTDPIGLSEVRGRWLDNEVAAGLEPDVADHFAWALAAGDFNGDGAEDLASGIPFDDDLGVDCVDCGVVVVRWGVPASGLEAGPVTTVLHQALAGSPDPPEAGERFGAALAAGDFNGDGFDDLAIGIPLASDVFWEGDGAVEIFYGWSTGFQTEFPEYFTENDVNVMGHDFTDAHFGSVLGVGNFDHDPYDDLVIGVPDGWESTEDAWVRGGSVYVAHGQPWGLLPWSGYRISQDEVEMQDAVEEGDLFGQAVAVGDFGSDSYDDLAIGVPGENDSGMIQILFGSQWGLLFATNIVWLPGAVAEIPEAGDRFGYSLAAGDFDGDFYDDLAIGDPFEDYPEDTNEIVDVGQIVIAFGSNTGFDLSRTIGFTQGVLYDDPAADGSGDLFGWSMATGDFDFDGFDDLVVGHRGEDAPQTNSGAVSVLMGDFGEQLGARHRQLAPGVTGVPGDAVGHQDFGFSLAVGDFDDNDYADLAVGVPWYDAPSVIDAGGAAVLYGALFADGFELGSAGRWSDPAAAPLP